MPNTYTAVNKTIEAARELLAKLNVDLDADPDLKARLEEIVESQDASTTYEEENMSTRDHVKRIFVEDNIFVEDKNEFHTPTPVGKTRSMTPEGFLLCEDVRIARVGEQVYGAAELTDEKTGKPAVEPGPDGVVVIGREPDEVFRDETVKSFEGKSVTVEHPNEFVNPDNYERVEVGTTHNVHRGEGADSDFLMADLLIKDKAAIAHVNRDMPQISCGYDSEYEQTEIGRGVQRNIVGNHVALVDRGRAGPRCAIRDSAIKSTVEDKTMAVKVKMIDRLMSLLTAVKTKDKVALDRALAEDEEGDEPLGESFGSMDAKFKDWMDTADKRFTDWMDAADKRMKDAEEEKKEKKDDEEEEKAKAEDTVINAETLGKNPDMLGRVWVGDSVAPLVKDILSRAEILFPGISIPSEGVTQRGLKNFMLTALSRASTTDDGKNAIAPFLTTDQKLDTLDGIALRQVFNGAAEVRRAQNNAGSRPTAVKTVDFGKPVTIDELNRANAEFWANGGKRVAGKK